MKKIIILLAAIAVILGGIVFALKGRKNAAPPPENKARRSGVSVPGLLSQARDAEAKKDFQAAKIIYQKLTNDFPASSEAVNWAKKAEEINIRLLFSSAAVPESKIYEVRPGDTLTKIAREFNTTTELIIKSNGLADDKIAPGRKLKVWTEPFTIFVDKSQNILILKTKDEEVIKTYSVSTGANNCTPVGNFKIVDKIPNPPWFKPGSENPIPSGSPENILGARWLGLNLPGYGIHGTTDPQSLGRQVTQGCVRMANSDVEELYTIVPKGTEVTIVD